jgi:hypothetical protein
MIDTRGAARRKIACRTDSDRSETIMNVNGPLARTS